MTPGQRSDYRKLPRIARWHAPRYQWPPLDAEDQYIPADFVSTWTDEPEPVRPIASTTVAMTHRAPVAYAARVQYVPVAWSDFDSADRYQCQS